MKTPYFLILEKELNANITAFQDALNEIWPNSKLSYSVKTNSLPWLLKYLKEKDIDVDSSVELLGDIDMYNDTLKDFLAESEDRLPKMEKYKNEEDTNNYAILAHAMKSDSKYLGFKTLAELSYKHELEGKANNISYIKEHYDELMEEVNRIIDIVNKYLGGK